MEIEIKRFLESVLYALNREIEPLLSQRVENLGSLVDSLRTVEQLKLQKDYLTDLMQTNLDPKVTFEEFVRVQRNLILEKVSEILHNVENSPFYLHPETVIEYGSKLDKLNTISSLLNTMVKAFEGLNVMFK